eukprot:m.72749 g.72749  ORF g.72749 m.72749 type:complete len:615 (+) comp13002_c0_seq1:3238-5082(+)
MSRPANPQAAFRQQGRRSSAWQVAQEQTVKGVSNVGNALGRWFGVTADHEEVQHRAEAYRRRKSGFVGPQGGMHRGVQPSESVVSQLKSVLNDSDLSSSDDEPADPADRPMTRNYAQGMAHYRDLRMRELNNAPRPGWFGGMNKGKDEEATDLGASRRQGASPPKRRHSKLRNDTLVARQLQALPTFTPYFIYLITFVQFALSVAFFAYAFSQNAFAPFGLGWATNVCTGFDCPDGFNGSTITVSRRVEHNFLYGPNSKYLLQFGAKLTPCMRPDNEGLIRAAIERDTQCGSTWGYPCESTSLTAGYGCCALSSSRKGMTDYATCMAAGTNSTWQQNTLCSEARDYIVIRPCCGIGLDSKCEIITALECSFRGGSWQMNEQLCSRTMCLGSLCYLNRGGFYLTANQKLANQPENANQWYRFILPLFLHAGVIQLAIIIAIQLYAGCDVEREAGFLRTLLIYFISGIGGYVISGIFLTSQVTTGADPAVYGLLAVLLVELFQSWQIVSNAWSEFFKLGGFSLLLLMVGTLPFIDNWSHIGGFVFGIVSGIVFLPYVTFGDWDLNRKRILLLICIPVLILMIVLAFVTFYRLQTTSFCSWCKYLNCIPYTSQIECS